MPFSTENTEALARIRLTNMVGATREQARYGRFIPFTLSVSLEQLKSEVRMALLQGKLPGTYAPPDTVRRDGEDEVVDEPVGKDLTGPAHRQLIGSVGLLLPILVYVFAGIAPNEPAHRWKPLWSISAYYYTSGVVAFIGLLISLSLYLFAYEGYKNDYHKLDKRWARIAATAAFGVALFPTSGPAGMQLRWWEPWMQLVHYIAAVTLFLAFAVFCFRIFTTLDPNGRDDPDKAKQNRIYKRCGFVIVAGMIAAYPLARFLNVPLFYPESIMLFAFATSWLVKGKIKETAPEVARRSKAGARNILRRGLHVFSGR